MKKKPNQKHKVKYKIMNNKNQMIQCVAYTYRKENMYDVVNTDLMPSRLLECFSRISV